MLLALCACTHHDDSNSTTQQAVATPPAPAGTVAQPSAAPQTNGKGNRPARVEPSAAPAQPTGLASPAGAPAKPAILSVSVSPATVHDGDTVSWDVETTPDVTAVEAHVRVATIPFERQGPGHFTMSLTIPKSVPGFFHSTYSVDVVVHAGDGETLTRSVPLVFR